MTTPVSTKRRGSHSNTKENKPASIVGEDVKRQRCNDTIDDAASVDVQTLLSGLSDAISDESKGASWILALQDHFSSSSFAQLARFVSSERAAHTIYPPTDVTWAALQSCPLDAVKVVIVGQDPYHGPDQAHGLCFSVLPGQAVPPSLKNIYKELMDDPEVPFASKAPTHGHLDHWARQGVLLLNTVLTVRKGQAHSHKKRGWEAVTDEIIRAVVQRRDSGCVFLLWGKPATEKALQVLNQPQFCISVGNHGKSERMHPSNHDNNQTTHHAIICTSHPSPLGARKTDSPFLGSRCFSRCNQALVERGEAPIDWNVDGGDHARP